MPYVLLWDFVDCYRVITFPFAFTDTKLYKIYILEGVPVEIRRLNFLNRQRDFTYTDRTLGLSIPGQCGCGKKPVIDAAATIKIITTKAINFSTNKFVLCLLLWRILFLIYKLVSCFNLLKPTGYVMHQHFKLLKPTGYVMHQQFNLLKPTG